MNMKCTNCGGTDFIKMGTRITRAGVRQNHQCKGCGKKQVGEFIKRFKNK